MIHEIFKDIVYISPAMQMEEKKAEQLIETLLEQQEGITQEESDKIREITYQVVNEAEENGFVVGFKCGVMLMMECMGLRSE